MDPQVTLQEIRWGFEDTQRELTNDDYTDQEALEDSFNRLKEHFDALDSWLRRGGLLPEEWGARALPPTPGELY